MQQIYQNRKITRQNINKSLFQTNIIDFTPAIENIKSLACLEFPRLGRSITEDDSFRIINDALFRNFG